MSKKDVKEFLLRGALFGGLGSIIVGFVLWMVSLGIDDFYLSGGHIFLAIVSGYILAFVQAGTTAFHQIESWSVVKSCGLQLLLLYVASQLKFRRSRMRYGMEGRQLFRESSSLRRGTERESAD